MTSRTPGRASVVCCYNSSPRRRLPALPPPRQISHKGRHQGVVNARKKVNVRMCIIIDLILLQVAEGAAPGRQRRRRAREAPPPRPPASSSFFCRVMTCAATGNPLAGVHQPPPHDGLVLLALLTPTRARCGSAACRKAGTRWPCSRPCAAGARRVQYDISDDAEIARRAAAAGDAWESDART